MASNKKYWKNLAQLDPSDKAVKKLEHNEFVSKLPKDFLSDEKTSVSNIMLFNAYEFQLICRRDTYN